MDCKGGDPRRQHRDGCHSGTARPAESRRQSREESQGEAGGHPSDPCVARLFVPLVWVASPAFSFAEYPLRLNPLIAGVVCLVVGLWLFYRSHADLGTNWSVTLQVREHHQLITHGVYQCVRHPMYSALFLTRLARCLSFRIGLLVRRTWSRLGFFSHFGSAMRRG